MHKKINTIHSVGFIPKKSLGQNFLIDEYVAEQIVYSAGNLENSVVLEIGSGTGVLTRHLLMSNAKKVIVVEIDERCIIALMEQYGSRYSGKLNIIHADAFSLHEEYLGTKCIIIANLPYNISTQLLIKWFHKIHLVKSMVLMFQKEVADRICAKKGSKAYSRISVLSQVLCDIEHKLDVMPSAFWPAPRVRSSVLKFVPTYKNIDIHALEKVCKVVFAHRRKVVRKQLYALFGADAKNIIDELKITVNNRIEELEPELLCKLAEKLS